ncbi:MAG TPA: 1,4-alpha-glucan branching protein GlgB [Acidimicrobiales bacterium]|nr:1,4-alpha-glucan branching protein GlgB [Acidimicrobiales bacterium]
MNRLLAGDHPDPHQMLGYHDGNVVAHRPDARAMYVLLPSGERVEMQRVRDEGLFVAEAPAAEKGYRLRAEYPNGDSDEFSDPYRFWPTLGEQDLHLFGEGRHRRLWEMLGAHVRTHQGETGTSFAVWAPNARSVRVVGDFNHWDGRQHAMRSMGSSGVWEIFVPGVQPGSRYKYEILTGAGHLTLKADPLAFATELRPGTNSLITRSEHRWGDQEWMEARDRTKLFERPLSIYEVHPGSWKRKAGEDERSLRYGELAEELADYVSDLGFTHVELMGVPEHPFDGSWGYQVSSYYAPTSRYGSPDEFRALVDALHQRGIGVIIDWVPAHFPRDEWALGRFDGTPLYEHEDPRLGEHPDWGTYIFNFGRHEVRNFLVANALFWLEEFHVDGLRVDGVASMLYRDYSREEGEWVPNEHGGNENLEAISLLKEYNEVVYGEHPGAITIAEESTSFSGVSRPTDAGGLGFGFKWNMGWMHDTLEYFSMDPVHRSYHQNELTFGLLYAFTENFILPLSHDEVVHGKGSLLDKMPGDRWQKAANLRALLAWMWAHPGKQVLFMGSEIAQSREWSFEESVDWHLLQYPEHRGVQDLVRELNRVYVEEAALWEQDFVPEGFRWIDASDTSSNVVSFLRFGAGAGPGEADGSGRTLACVANLSPVPRDDYRIGLPERGAWRLVLNTDDARFGGGGLGPAPTVQTEADPRHGFDFSVALQLPPLAVLWLTPGRV